MRKLLFSGIAALFAVAILVLAASFYMGSDTKPYIYASVADVPQAEAALVLGASVTSAGALSAVLKERAQTAVELYAAGKVGKILVTGDNSTLSHNEVNPVGNYLTAAGIPKDDIFLDHAGFDTYSSMYRARDVFGVRSMVIVSQAFHLPRAIYVARRLGLKAYGVDAGEGESFFFNYAREVPASVKAFLDLAFARVPKYLGEQYPITGDGSSTWYEATTTTAGQTPSGDSVGTSSPGGTSTPPAPVACTAEAKRCPDGSYVGRTGPNCTFAPCAFAPKNL